MRGWKSIEVKEKRLKLYKIFKMHLLDIHFLNSRCGNLLKKDAFHKERGIQEKRKKTQSLPRKKERKQDLDQKKKEQVLKSSFILGQNEFNQFSGGVQKAY